MMCIKHMLLYVLVFPLSASPPIFLACLGIAALLRIKPCGYCLTLATILFLSSSPNSPFLKHSSHSPSLQSGQIQPLSSLPLDAPVPDRTWLTFNGGQIWDASLVGYREMNKALEMERNTTSEAGHDGRQGRRLGGIWQEGPRAVKEYVLAVREGLRKGQRPALVEKVYQSKKVLSRLVSRGERSMGKNEGRRYLPALYVDWRYKGIGFVLDFGLKRSEEGLKWEIEEMLGRAWDREELKPIGKKDDRGGVSGETADANERSSTQAEETSEKMKAETRQSLWRKVPLVGSW
ncbi:hypothetical protein AYX13_00897 [Cryptococcus neoformans]|nr:hypothetical protein AYX13_00897 [Cryptococcus neoformans var. grubii]